MSVQAQRGPADAVIETYGDQREECAALARACHDCGRVVVSDRDLAFAACRVATDREQQAGGVRPELIDRGREVQAIGGAAGHVDELRPGSPVHPGPEVGTAIPVPG